MKTNGDDPISASAPIQFQMTEKDELLPIYGPGLTKREYFAAMALQGTIEKIGACDWNYGVEHGAEFAVECADALIKALNSEGEDNE